MVIGILPRFASGTFVRVGSTNRRADAEMVQELRRSGRGETYDEQPMADLHSEALDFRAASECTAPTLDGSAGRIAGISLPSPYEKR